VLVERPDRRRSLLRKAELAGDVGAALAAGLEEVSLRALLEAEPHERRGTTERRALGRDVPHGPDEVLREARPFDRLHPSLEPKVVAAEERADLGGVRRAAHVLQQERVVEVGSRLGIEAELVGEAHSDQTRPNRVPGRLALGDVERVGERRDHLGHPEPGPGRAASVSPSAAVAGP